MNEKKTMSDVFLLFGGPLYCFSAIYRVPYSTVCAWSSGKRKPPQYVVDLFLRDVLCNKGYCSKK